MQQTNTKGVQDEARVDRKGDPLELCKRLKFDHTTKWYLHEPESVLENETHKILSEFGVKLDHPISVIRLYLEIKRELFVW